MHEKCIKWKLKREIDREEKKKKKKLNCTFFETIKKNQSSTNTWLRKKWKKAKNKTKACYHQTRAQYRINTRQQGTTTRKGWNWKWACGRVGVWAWAAWREQRNKQPRRQTGTNGLHQPCALPGITTSCSPFNDEEEEEEEEEEGEEKKDG